MPSRSGRKPVLGRERHQVRLAAGEQRPRGVDGVAGVGGQAHVTGVEHRRSTRAPRPPSRRAAAAPRGRGRARRRTGAGRTPRPPARNASRPRFDGYWCVVGVADPPARLLHQQVGAGEIRVSDARARSRRRPRLRRSDDLALELGEEVRRQLLEAMRRPDHRRSSPATNSSENVPSQTCSTGPDRRTARSADDLHHEVATVGVHGHRALDAPGDDRRHGGSARSRSRRQGLPRSPLPDPHPDLVPGDGPVELDVRPVREPRRGARSGLRLRAGRARRRPRPR